MNETHRILLEILSNSLFCGEPGLNSNEISDICDWNRLLEEAQLQGVYGLVFNTTKRTLQEELDPSLFNKALSMYYQMIRNNTNNAYYHKLLHAILTENNIPYVIIKGQASGAYYPDPRLRTSGDVDFFIKKGDLERSGKLLEENGFSRTKDKEHGFHIAYYDKMQTIEMHWEVGGVPVSPAGSICKEILGGLIENEKEHGGIMVPDDFRHGVILLLHTARHMINTGIGIRHLCDWAVYVNKVDVSKFEIPLRNMGLWRFAQLLTQVSVYYLSCPFQNWAMEEVDGELLEKIINDILAAGEFGIKNPERINEAKVMTTDSQGNVGRNSFIQFFRMLTEQAKKALPICDEIYFLIPIGWLYVSVRHLVRIRRGLRPSIHFRTMLRGAEQRREIYKEFKLFE